LGTLFFVVWKEQEKEVALFRGLERAGKRGCSFSWLGWSKIEEEG
jgi:hypothetical protein